MEHEVHENTKQKTSEKTDQKATHEISEKKHQEVSETPSEHSGVQWLIKNLLPIISISIILMGLIIIYRVTDVSTHITNEMRLFLGYLLSFGLYGLLMVDRIKKTSMYSQIIMSTIITALTLTTAVGTHVYDTFSLQQGLIISLCIFIAGLILAYRHRSEIEFSTLIILGFLLPFLYTFESYQVLVYLEISLIFSLYVYFYFFKNPKFTQYLLLYLGIVIIDLLLLFGIFTTPLDDELHRRFAVYSLYIVSIVGAFTPFYFERLKALTFSYARIVHTISLLLAYWFIFMSLNRVYVNVPLAHLFHFVFISLLYFGTAYYVKNRSYTSQMISMLFLGSLHFIATFFFYDVQESDFFRTIIVMYVYTTLVLTCIESLKTSYVGTKSRLLLRVLFYGLYSLATYMLLYNISIFFLRLGYGYGASLSITERVLYFTSYFLGTFVLARFSKHDYILRREERSTTLYTTSALYFTYTPWQLLSLFAFAPWIKLVSVTYLWLAGAYVAILIQFKKKKDGLRLFTLLVLLFLLLKLVFIDIPFFRITHQMLIFGFYSILLGISFLLLTRLMIQDIKKNGRYFLEMSERKKARREQQRLERDRREREHQEAMRKMNEQEALQRMQEKEALQKQEEIHRQRQQMARAQKKQQALQNKQASKPSQPKAMPQQKSTPMQQPQHISAMHTQAPVQRTISNVPSEGKMKDEAVLANERLATDRKHISEALYEQIASEVKERIEKELRAELIEKLHDELLDSIIDTLVLKRNK